jgi:aldehyde:ferredoxin oxidoreductase
MIIDREGLGDTLADGWYAFSEKFGVDPASDHPWVGIAKGFDTIVDARFWGLDSTTFAYFVNPRGHHGIVHSLQYGGNPVFNQAVLKEDLRNTGATEDVVERIFTPVPYYGGFNAARMTRHVEDRGAIIQALGVCDNLSAMGFFPMEALAEWYSAVTGFETDPEELKTGGERIHNLFKVLNMREGFSRIDDTVPAWFSPISTPEGEAAMRDYYGERVLSRDDLASLLDDYYEERGWNKEKGIPTPAKLAELGLDQIFD